MFRFLNMEMKKHQPLLLLAMDVVVYVKLFEQQRVTLQLLAIPQDIKNQQRIPVTM